MTRYLLRLFVGYLFIALLRSIQRRFGVWGLLVMAVAVFFVIPALPVLLRLAVAGL